MTPAQKKAHVEFERRLKEAGGSKITVRLDAETTARLADHVARLGSREKVFRAAILAYRSTPPVQDTAAGPESAIEQTQAERRSREPPKKAKAITLPAKPVKGIQPVEKPVSVDIQIGPTPVKAGDRLKTVKGTKR